MGRKGIILAGGAGVPFIFSEKDRNNPFFKDVSAEEV